eukprot:250025-Alexandrium_andersonii.AAC.2
MAVHPAGPAPPPPVAAHGEQHQCPRPRVAQAAPRAERPPRSPGGSGAPRRQRVPPPPGACAKEQAQPETCRLPGASRWRTTGGKSGHQMGRTTPEGLRRPQPPPP